MNRRTARILSVTAATLVAWLIGTGTATPAMQWEGQWNPQVRLDLTQVAAPAPDAAPVEVDCWDDASCAVLADDGTGLEDAPDMVDESGATHTGCLMLPLDDVTYVLCEDGWTTQS